MTTNSPTIPVWITTEGRLAPAKCIQVPLAPLVALLAAVMVRPGLTPTGAVLQSKEILRASGVLPEGSHRLAPVRALQEAAQDVLDRLQAAGADLEQDNTLAALAAALESMEVD